MQLSRQITSGLLIALLLNVPPAAAPAAQGVVYTTGPNATDAEKIAVQMLNEASSKVIDRITWDNPYSEAFGRYADDLRANERARIDDALEYANRISEEYADRQRTEQYIAMREAEARAQELEREAWESKKAAWEAEASRMRGVIVDYLSATEPARSIEGALRAERGQLHGYTYGHDGNWEYRDLRRELYKNAALQGEVLGLIGLAGVEGIGDFELGDVLAAAQARRSPEERLAYLIEESEQRYNLVAQLCLGAWCTGRDVGLGRPPEKAPDGSSLFDFGMDWLARTGNAHATGSALVAYAAAKDPQRSELFGIALRKLWPDTQHNQDWTRGWIYQLAHEQAMARWRGSYVRFELEQAMGATGGRQTPAAALELGRALFDGNSDSFDPFEARRLLDTLPDSPHWARGRALATLAAAYCAEWPDLERGDGPRGTYDPGKAANAFARALDALARLPGGANEHESASAREARLWLLSLRERGHANAATRDASRAELDALIAGGDAFGSVLRVYHALRDTAIDRDTARARWAELSPLYVFDRTHPVTRGEVLRRCMTRLIELGVLPDAGLLREVQGTDPGPMELRGILAKAALTGFQSTDLAAPRNLAGVFGALVDSARFGTTARYVGVAQWRRVAALAEVLQVDALAPEVWDRTWLAPFLAAAKAGGGIFHEEPQALLDLLRGPSSAALQRVEARDQASFVLSDDECPDVQALLASAALRCADTTEWAEAATDRLLALADADTWHAQALLETFERRYRRAYLDRADVEGYRRDYTRVQEWLARARLDGRPFLPRDPDRAAGAMTLALLRGSTTLTRDDLVALREQAPNAAADGLLLIDQQKATALSQDDLDSIEIQSYLLRTDLERRGESLMYYTTRERVLAIARALHALRGAEPVKAYLERQRALHPWLDWDLGEAYYRGNEWLTADGVAALACFRRARAAAPDDAQLGQHLLHWEVAAEHGEAADWRVALDEIRATDLTTRMLRIGIVGWRVGGALHALALRFAASGDATAAYELDLHAVALGNSEAFAQLRSRSDPSPTQCVALGRALLEASTLNARLALPHFERAGPAGAADLAAWQNADGTPNWRYAFVEELRKDKDLDDDELAWPAETPELEPERVQLYKRAWQPEAAAVATNVYGIPALLLDVWPELLHAHVHGALRKRDWTRLFELLDVAPFAIRELEARGMDARKSREDLGEVIGLAAGVLARLESAPDGFDRATFLTRVDALLDMALAEESLDAYGIVLERASSAGEPALIALAARLLDIDGGNGPLLEKTLRPRLKDAQTFDALFRRHGLFAPGVPVKSEPSPTAKLRFLRERGSRTSAQRMVDGEIVEDAAWGPGVVRAHPEWKHGSYGALLARLNMWESPLLTESFAELGLRPEDAYLLRVE